MSPRIPVHQKGHTESGEIHEATFDDVIVCAEYTGWYIHLLVCACNEPMSFSGRTRLNYLPRIFHLSSEHRAKYHLNIFDKRIILVIIAIQSYLLGACRFFRATAPKGCWFVFFDRFEQYPPVLHLSARCPHAAHSEESQSYLEVTSKLPHSYLLGAIGLL